MSTGKKEFGRPVIGLNPTDRPPGLVEEPVEHGSIHPIVTPEELEKVLPLSEDEERWLVELGEKIERGETLTEGEKERAKILLKKRKSGAEFSSKPSISINAIKVFFKG